MSAPTSVDAALRAAITRGVDRLDAQLLLALALDRPRTWLFAHGEAALDADAAARFADFTQRRAGGEPLAYIRGEKEFHGLTLAVDRHVLVPRPETELLVDWALELLGGPFAHVAEPAVVDLGTGSGAIAIAVKHRAPRAAVLATDISGDALRLARRNAERWHADIAFVDGSWWQPLEGRRFHVILSNPPYVAAGDTHLAALRHEPIGALVSGCDGKADLQAVIGGAAAHLEAGGWIGVEHGFDQAQAVGAMLQKAGFHDVQTRADSEGRARCTGARSLP